jgi:hypothetical protein
MKWPSALNASSGPYDDDDRPSAPSPTHARNATSDIWWNTFGSRRSRARPNKRDARRCMLVKAYRPVVKTAYRRHQRRIKMP